MERGRAWRRVQREKRMIFAHRYLVYRNLSTIVSPKNEGKWVKSWLYRCPDGHECNWCGPLVARKRQVAKLVAQMEAGKEDINGSS